MLHMARRLLPALAFAGILAAGIVMLGTRDLESYDHSFFSLDRGTRVQAVHVLGHPVYTLSVGLGVRLPLHASLGASPAAAIAPFVPQPVTYWLLLTLAIGAAVLVAGAALRPLCGRATTWAACVALFYSVPVVNYAIYDDWPETAVTYCAFVAAVFAPHAMLAQRRVGRLAVAAIVLGLVAGSHPGYWPLLAVTLVLASLAAIVRVEMPLRRRFGAAAVLGIAAATAVVLQAPDILREVDAAGPALSTMRRVGEGPRGPLLATNFSPTQTIGARSPFTFLGLTLVSVAVALTTRDAQALRLTVAAAIVAIALGVGATRLDPGTSTLAPSVTWALRDPAIAFAVFGAACAAGALWRGTVRRPRAAALLTAVVAIAALQGPVYAVRLVRTGMPNWESHRPWTHDFYDAAERAPRRGLMPDRVPAGTRLALWPSIANQMRNGRRASMDFADAGYQLVTAWTKQRTMRRLVEPNNVLFSQQTELPEAVLCSEAAVRFLQLRYLILPGGAGCPPWTRVPGVAVDEILEVATAGDVDPRVRALPIETLAEPIAAAPALSAGATLIDRLEPLPGTSLRIEPSGLDIDLGAVPAAGARALVLPVAYDNGWRASSGDVQSVGGLLAITDARASDVRVTYAPDGVAVARAAGMTLAQLALTLGVLGVALAAGEVSA